MTKVCHMTSAHNSEDDRIFHKECVSLADWGYEVYLVAPGNSYEKNGVKIVGIGKTIGGRLNRMLKVTRQAYNIALKIDADIYHFHDPELLPYGLKLKKKGKKVIFDSHEKYTEQIKSKQYLPYWCAVIVANIYQKYEMYVLNQIDAVIFPCMIRGKNPFFNLCKNSTIISNAARLDEFYDTYNKNVKKHERGICYIGGLTRERGITNAMQAVYKAGATLYLAGSFSSKKYEDEMRKSFEFSKVQYLGVLGRPEVKDLLQSCKVGICTLLNIGQYHLIDTFGVKVFEYMSMGLPIVVSDTKFARDVVHKYQCGICVNPESVEEIKNAIQYLLDNPKEAKRMGENGRRAIKEEFNWGEEEKKLLALYKDILEN